LFQVREIMQFQHIDQVGRDVVGLVILVSLGLTLGVVANNFRSQSLSLVYATKASRMEQAVARVAALSIPPVPVPGDVLVAAPTAEAALFSAPPPSNVHEIELTEFQRRLAAPGAILLDARPEIFHRFGHIPGALPLPRDEFEAYYPKHRARLEAYKDREILIYCQGSSCEDSHLVAQALAKLGYKRLAVFAEGWNAWTQQGLPQEKQ
jgi:rhodanese-related sulfurtransferase